VVGDGREQPHDNAGAASVIVGHPPVRGTQSFVYTLSACWRRPSLTGLEVLWRWGYGVPALAVVAYEAMQVLRATPVNVAALRGISLTDPMAGAETLSQATASLGPAVLKVAVWLAPLLGVAWVVVSAFGRGVVLRRIDARLHARQGTVMVLQAVRMVALAASFAVWFVCLRGAAEFAVNGPIATGQDPNLVLYSALVILATLGLFTLWAVASWGLAVAPLLAMRRDLGAGASLAEAFRLGPLRSKLVEINLVMGIVKIALIVLALVLSACPLPFESVATQGFMEWWYVIVTILYLIASDFFHVVHLAAYLELWNVYEPKGV
jgi:hypothetical protein